MPMIMLGNCSWKQDDNNVCITIPFNGNWHKVDIFTSTSYLKIHCPPYLFEKFLYSEIDDKLSTCTYVNDNIVFQLRKKISEKWPQLHADLSKSEMAIKRQEVVESVSQMEKMKEAKIKQTKHDMQQVAVQQQINLDTLNIKVVEDLKKIEKQKVNIALEDLKEPCSRDELEIKERSNLNPSRQDSHLSKTQKTSSCADNFLTPLPRRSGSIKVRFTERDFPTPTRESMNQEEQTWLKTQLEARRASGFVVEDLRPEECDPVWLKSKGDSFYEQKNYLGAISAYSHGIKLGSTMPSLYSNRSACHMELGNLHKSLEDCSKALELLHPPVHNNADSRARCHARRGVLLCRLGLPEKSFADFQEAIKLCPDDFELKNDYDRAFAMSNGNEDSDE